MMYFTFSDKQINNIDSKFKGTVEKFNRKPNSPIRDQNKVNCNFEENSCNEDNKRNEEDTNLTKNEGFSPCNKNSNALDYKDYSCHNDVKETEHFKIEESDSALKQIESMMGRNYSDFMRSLASKYNKE